MFLLNSRLDYFSAALLPEHPFSRSYGVILPSSLTRVFSRALGFSPHLPVSVCGTGTSFLARGFSWQFGLNDFGTLFPSPSHLKVMQSGFAYSALYVLGRTLPSVRFTYPPASPHRSNGSWWHWNFNQLYIPYAFRPRVSSRLTLGGRAFPRKPQVYGGQDSHLPSRLLMPAFSLLNCPPLLPVRLLPVKNAPLPSSITVTC